MRFGFPILMVSTGALVVAGGFALATAEAGTTSARPVAFAVPANPSPATIVPAAVTPAATAVLRTRSVLRARPAAQPAPIRATGPRAANP